mmetsp:Transcript_115469/g.321704  ORF Transcript_115469/g.321704 Transcript_115469/m.321704 type:complete len:222 (+) Transcript_115469:241-906(+)
MQYFTSEEANMDCAHSFTAFSPFGPSMNSPIRLPLCLLMSSGKTLKLSPMRASTLDSVASFLCAARTFCEQEMLPASPRSTVTTFTSCRKRPMSHAVRPVAVPDSRITSARASRAALSNARTSLSPAPQRAPGNSFSTGLMSSHRPCAVFNKAAAFSVESALLEPAPSHITVTTSLGVTEQKYEPNNVPSTSPATNTTHFMAPSARKAGTPKRAGPSPTPT